MKVDGRTTQNKKGDKKFAPKPRVVPCARCATEFMRVSPAQRHCSPKCRLLDGIKESLSGCWEWQKSTVRGYGCIRIDGGYEYTHRLAWELLKGEIPAGEGAHGTIVMHKCDNRLCCNPEHLQLGTQAENLADMARKGRSGNLGRVMPEEQRRKISATKLARKVAA